MSDVLTVLRPNADALAVLDDLSRPLEERIYGPIADAGYEAPLPVLTQRPAPLQLRYTDRATTLTAADYRHDPLIVRDKGRMRAPLSEQKKIRALDKAGLDPDHVLVIREIPGFWRPGETPPRMIGHEFAETTRERHLQHLQVGAAAFAVGKALLYTAGAAVVLATGTVVALGAITVAGVTMAPLAAGLDPLVLAGIDHPETGSVAWTVVAAWDEIEDVRGW